MSRSKAAEAVDAPRFQEARHIVARLVAEYDRWLLATHLRPAITGRDEFCHQTFAVSQRLIGEVAEHLRAGTSTDTRKAVAKLERIAELASTLALTVKTARR